MNTQMLLVLTTSVVLVGNSQHTPGSFACSNGALDSDHVPLEAKNKELSRHESNSQQAVIINSGVRNHAAQLAIIKQLSRQELHSTAGNCQADEQTVITQLSRP